MSSQHWNDPAVLTSLIIAITGLIGAIGGLLAAYHGHITAKDAQAQNKITDAKVETLTKVANGNLSKLLEDGSQHDTSKTNA